MIEQPINVASLQIPNLEISKHLVSQYYHKLKYDANFDFMFNQFLSLIFVNNISMNDLILTFENPETRYNFFIAINPTLLQSVADTYSTFFIQFIDSIKDKYVEYVSQAHLVKQITTGNPLVASIKLTRHYTGWYIVIY